MAIPSPNMGLVIFVIITVIYFIISYATEESSSNFAIYILLLLGIQIGISINLTKELCGEVQIKNAFLYTILPWTLIFGILNLLLLVFPGWLKPFSNTIGYYIANFSGDLNNILASILKTHMDTKNSGLNETLGKIYENQALLINEIPNAEEGFENFWKNLSDGGLLADDADSKKDDLQKIVKLKFIISKFIWFTLSGLLTISTSYNYLVKSGCNTSVKEMVKRHNDYEKIVAENNNKTVENKRIYTDTGE